MLLSLHIRNYILLDALDVKFPDGLVIITGQTGAGKSILLGALGLLSGEKADASAVSGGAETCVVEGEFSTPEGLRTIRRVIYSSGRSRSFIDDCPVSLQELAELGGRLFDIHSQHRSLMLTDSRFQLSLLDRYAGCRKELEECRRLWKELRECRSGLERVNDLLEKAAAESSYNAAQLAELEAARLRDGELEELEEEQLSLGNAEEILERLAFAASCLDDGVSTPVRDSLSSARKALENVEKYLPATSELAARIDSARIELDDISSEIESIARSVSVSPDRLAEVEQRLSLLYRLMSKHGCRTVAELIQARESFAVSARGEEDLQEQKAALEKQLASLEKSYTGICATLHDKRAAAAKGFAEEVTDGLRFLELGRATFSVSLTQAAPGPEGTDAADFLFSADGKASVPIGKCASGGELSRIMLSLKALMARFEGMPTMIFDEIDTGVSGSVAAKMGQMICRMGESMQVFAITHLPQVAAKGSAHYLVTKTFDSEAARSVSGIHSIDGEERVAEIARLLSGEAVTPEAVANARALLKEGGR